MKEIKDEERAAAAGEQTMAPSDPLPEAVAIALDNGVAALNGGFKALAASLSAALTAIKAGLCREKDFAIAAVQADADSKIAEADDEVRDAMIAAERFEGERDAARQRADNLAAELAATKEALAASNARWDEQASNAKSWQERADQAVQDAGEARAEVARLAAELKAATGRKGGTNA